LNSTLLEGGHRREGDGRSHQRRKESECEGWELHDETTIELKMIFVVNWPLEVDEGEEEGEKG